MTLHEAIVRVLEERRNRPLTAREIADAIASEGLYVRPSDGESPPSGQVSARIGTGQSRSFFLRNNAARPVRYYLSTYGWHGY